MKENGPALWDELMEVLRLYFDSPIVAGGAVRDWCISSHPKDIDVFVWGTVDDLEDKCPWLTPMSKAENNEYASMKDVLCVWEGHWNELLINVVLINREIIPEGDGAALVRTFDFGITRQWWDLDGLHVLREAHHDMNAFTATLLIGDKRERSIRRFERFNQRHNNKFTMVDKCSTSNSV